MTASAGWKELQAEYVELIERFGRGWEHGKPNEIAELFSEDGIFSPSPFDAPLLGRSAILEYWKDIPREQAEIVFRFGELFVAGPWFATEIKCTFRRRRTGQLMDVRGALFCETIEGKIAEMRMYWHRAAK
jgi:ketosteroid isomerase-like protein